MHNQFLVLDLFSGIGGFSLGLEKIGMKTVAFCEIDEFCQKILKQHWPNVPIFKDIRELNDEKLRSVDIRKIDILSAGFPCQDISISGHKKGLSGERSGLWVELLRIISEIRPRYALLENVPNLLAGDNGTWFATILGNLAEIGYNAEWHCIPASVIGAPHVRDRVWIIAHSSKSQSNQQKSISQFRIISIQFSRIPWWPSYAGIRRTNDGVPNWLDRIGACGNSVVPQLVSEIGKCILAFDKLQNHN